MSNNNSIKNIQESKIQVSFDKYENQVELFIEHQETNKKGSIILKGEGSLKTLISV